MNLSVLLLAVVAGIVPVDGIVAVVGSVPVLHSDVVSFLVEAGVAPGEADTLFRGHPLYDGALGELVNDKLFVEAARRQGLFPSPAQINARTDEIIQAQRAEFPTEAAFLQALSSSGLTLQTYREILATNVSHQIAIRNFAQGIGYRVGRATVPSNIESHIDENLDEIREMMEFVNLQLIYLPVLPVNTAEAMALLNLVRERVESGETSFDIMAMEYSQDGSARTGGDLGWFSRGDMTPAFEVRLWDLEPGEMAGPFVTPFGVHLAMVTDREDGRIRASHILRLVPVEPEDVNAVAARADSILASLTSGEITFETAAALYSLDPETRLRGGNLGTTSLSGFEEPLRLAISELQPGETTTPQFIEQGAALAILRVSEDQTPDFSGYTQEDLLDLWGAFNWQKAYRETTDSLRNEIPVFYPGF